MDPFFILTINENFLIVGGKHREQEDEPNGNFTPAESRDLKGTEGVSMAGRKNVGRPRDGGRQVRSWGVSEKLGKGRR